MLFFICTHVISTCVGATLTMIFVVCMSRTIHDLKNALQNAGESWDNCKDHGCCAPAVTLPELVGTFSSLDIEILKLRRVLPVAVPDADMPTGSFPVYSSREMIERLPVDYVYDGATAWFEAVDETVAALIPGDSYFVRT